MHVIESDNSAKNIELEAVKEANLKTNVKNDGEVGKESQNVEEDMRVEEKSPEENVKRQACGVVIQAYSHDGRPNSTYIRSAVHTIRRIRNATLAPGWCSLDPLLDEIPITLSTNVSRYTLLNSR